MRRPTVAPVACVLVMLTLWPALAQQTLDVPGHVDRAVRLLLSPDSTDASCIEGLVSLLDAIAAAAPAAGIEPDVLRMMNVDTPRRALFGV